MRLRLISFATLALALLLEPACFATPIMAGVYQLTNTSVGSNALSGTLTLNASGIVTAGKVTYNNGSAGTPVFSTLTASGVNPYGTSVDYAELGGSAGTLYLQYFATESSAGSIGLCLSNAGCGTYTSSYVSLGGGSYTAVTAGSLAEISSTGAAGYGSSAAVTPEPSTLLLLGTGIVGVIFLRLRKGRKRLESARNLPA